ncbi:MAG TPA: glycosyl hydrolase family 8 [Thermoanaerobaculia bacterium]|nr:glycosyl hydrolase family 8 [Thermoanaerobaculia bacterium]
MSKRVILVAAALLALIGGQPPASAAGAAQRAPRARRPFPQHVTYARGTIRPGDFTQAAQDQHVRDFYDRWKRDFVKAVDVEGAGGYRVSFGSTNPARTVSEGQGYGMVIVALMAGHDPEAKAIFDGLWRFARAHPSAIDHDLMTWQVPEVAGESDSAFDGDADIAYGLLLADKQWGSKGAVDYKGEAQRVIRAILRSTIGPRSRLPMLGDWTKPDGSPHNQYTPRSSDLMIDHFRAYRTATKDRAWAAVVAACQSVVSSLQRDYSPATGLLPDFIVGAGSAPQPAPAGFLEGDHDGHYYYNALRVPWRLGTDALIHGDAVSLAQVRLLGRWIASSTHGDPHQIWPGYRLDGTPIGGSFYFTTAFASPFGVAAMTDPALQEFLDATYAAVHDRHQGYYEDSLTLMSLLVMSGNFWSPAARTAH